ncbi:LCP family protein [Corynebacterium uterequi]|uniref:Transcriptional attenuator, LytR family n=1 Tax=Corynebacterium uterequi TaxID=1072256 RepID=A0A0G3HFK7_9CORY|nr:LCP family protein [Corynebacterium uterequi]AKK12099.1 transcriptional attenuator, LytR family [Corynebacterium uterequi]
MTHYGRDERRLRGHSSDPRDAAGEFVIGRDGKPLVDRYGRPVRRNPSAGDQHRGADGPRVTRQPRQPAEPRAAYEPRRTPQHGGTQRPAQQYGSSQQYGASQRGSRHAQQGQPLPPRQQPPRQQPPRQQPGAQRAVQHMPSRPPRGVVRGDEQLLINEPPRQKRQQRRARPRIRLPFGGCFGCFGSLLAVLLVGVIMVTLWADTRLSRVEALSPNPIADTAGTNWLLVGSDSRRGLSDEEAARLGTGTESDAGGSRTDAIMLLHIPFGGEAQLMSIPRDSLVTIPGYGENKINAAFALGGPQLLTETVEAETGLRINHYAEIGMGGLATMVDAVGGVEICVEEAIDDPNASLNVQPGCQAMDGATALGYVRTRATAGGDFDRVARQRQFFSSLLGTLSSPSTLLNPLKSVPLLVRATGTFAISEGTHVWHLAMVAIAMAGGVKSEVVPPAGTMDTGVGNVVLWDEAAAEEMFASMR